MGKQWVKVNGMWVDVYPQDTWQSWAWYSVAVGLAISAGIWLC